MIKYYNLVKPWSRWLFLMMFLFSLQSKALTQDSIQVSINAVNKPIEVVFKQIERQTGYTVFYGRPTLNGDELVTLQTRASLSSVMNAVLKGRNVNWALRDRSIILTRRTVTENGSNNLDTVPKVNILGNVVDKSGTPIVGATVSLKGQAMGQATDFLGQFRFVNVPLNTILIVSSVGYETKQYRLSGPGMVHISLDTLIQDIRPIEVVYTGYQQISKERTAGSFVQIDNELFNRRIGANVLDRLNEIVPGLLKRGNSSNQLENYIIRGVSTIKASSAPLLVVDNFIFDGDPNSLNPNDVESITVLKDATAASIWGVRAGNGVIVVTTKKGKANRAPTFSFISNVTIREKPDLYAIPSVPSKDVIDLERSRFEKGYYNTILNNTRTYPVLSPAVEILAKARRGEISQMETNELLETLANHDIRDDINKYLLQTGIAQQYAITISGGTAKHQYYGSLGYDRNRTHNVNINNERLSLRLNNKWKPLERIAVIGEVNWTKSSNTNFNSLGTYNAVLNNPYTFLADGDGTALPVPNAFRSTYVDTVSFPGKVDWKYYPLDESKNGNDRISVNNIRIIGGANYEITKGLSVEISYQWQTAVSESKTIQSMETFATRNTINQYVALGANSRPIYPYPLGAMYQQANSAQSAWNVRGQLNFDRTFGRHQITSLAGYEAKESEFETLQMPVQYGYNEQINIFQPVQFGTWNSRPAGISTAITPTTSTISGTLNRFNSIYLNAAYAFGQKYIFNISGRIDQSNFFGVKANDRKVPLWSIGAAWNITNEEFYKVSWLSVLKLRATYGYSGNVNAGISPLATIRYNLPVTSHPVFIPFASIATSPNPQLRWEKVETTNLGLDFGFSNNRLSGSIEVYQKRGLDLISDISVAPSSGFIIYTGNNSSINGKGIDLAIRSVNTRGAFKWSTSLILAYNEEKVTSYSAKLPNGFISPAIVSTNSIPIIGKPLAKLYSYKWAGLNANSGDAQLYINGQKTGSVDNSKARLTDYIYNGRTTPPYFGAIRNDFNWKCISLSFNISYGWGHYFRRESFLGVLGRASGIATWEHKDYLNAWKVPGDELITNVPGFRDSYTDNRYNVFAESEVLIEKGDYLSLQDIKLSYNITQQSLKKLPAKVISLYIYANNLGFIWKASQYNPDTRGGLSVPVQKSIAVGLNVSF